MRTVTTLGLDDARKAAAAVEAELRSRGKPAVIAVADAHGELILLIRHDGAPLPSILIAANKAFTAAREGKPTRDIGQAARDPVKGFDIAYFGDRRYLGWGGGVPVRADGQVVGAVAVSGLPQLEDMELAALGAAAIQSGGG
jgi:glc operon protein GlcG